MNGARRERLRYAIGLLGAAESVLETACDEERDALGNMPENLENSDRYVSMENAVDRLEDAIENVQEAIGNVDSAVNS